MYKLKLYNVSEILNLNMIFILYYLLHMKKVLVGAFLGMFAVAGVAVLPNYANAASGNFQTSDWADIWNWDEQNLTYNPEVAWSKAFQKDNLIKTIQKAINWVLWMLSLIALALCLYGGFLMMTSGGDSKKYESGLNILKWAGIGLAVIALSWLVVSLIFYIIRGSTVTDNSWTTGTV